MSAVAWRESRLTAIPRARFEIERDFDFNAAEDGDIRRMMGDGWSLWQIADALDRDSDLVAARMILLAHYGAVRRKGGV